MTSRLENRLWLYVAIIFGVAILAITVFVFASPVMFLMGIAGLIYGTIPLGFSLGFGIPGLIITVIGLWVVIVDVFEERQKIEKSGTSNLMIGVTVLGIIEILFGILQSFDDIEFFEFMFIGGGCITLLPLFIFIVVVIYQKKTGKSLGPLSLTNLSSNAKHSFSKFRSKKWNIKILEIVILSAIITGTTIGINYGIQESNRSLIVQGQFTLGNQVGYESSTIFEHESFVNNEYRSLNLSMYAENSTLFKIFNFDKMIDEITVNGTESYNVRTDFTKVFIISLGNELRDVEISVNGTPTQFYSLSLLPLLIIIPWLIYTIVQIKKGKLRFKQIKETSEETSSSKSYDERML